MDYIDETAQDIAEDEAEPGGFFVVDQTDAIHKSGSYAECRAFLVDPITREVAAAGGLDFSVCSADDWNRRNDPGDPTEDDPAEDPEPDSSDGVPMPTQEEMREFWRQQHALDDWAHSLTAEQRNRLCDMGYYNDTMKGYCLRAAREMGLTEDQSRELLRCFEYALDVMDKEEAENLYRCTNG